MRDEHTASREDSIAEIFARLEEEVRGQAPSRLSSGEGEEGNLIWSAARGQAEQSWPVSADRPYLYKPGAWGRIRGLALVPVKFATRKLVRWYVEPPILDQRKFNSAVLRLIDELDARTRRDAERIQALEAQLRSETSE